MKIIKKYIKWITVGLCIVIFAVLVYKGLLLQAFVLVPTALSALFQSNEEQEKLAEMQIEKIEKEQKEKEEQERFEKMLRFTKKIICSIRDGSELEKIEFTKDNFKKIIKGNKITKKEEIIRNILLIKLPDKINIFSYFMKELNTTTGEISVLRLAKDIYGNYPFELFFTERNKCIFFFDDNDCYCPDDEQYSGKMKSYFKKDFLGISGNSDIILIINLRVKI